MRNLKMPEIKLEKIYFLFGRSLFEAKVKGRSFLLFVIIVLSLDRRKN